MNKKYKYIIFDFNGTLYDDVDYCLKIENEMLTELNCKPINKELYLSLFCFPIKKYYELIGFDLQKYDFEMLAKRFVKKYLQDVKKLKLNKHVEEILSYLSLKGYKLVLLSATEKHMLLDQLAEFSISKYFDEIIGIDNVYAKSKLASAKAFLERSKAKKILVIGDTDHDVEVANALNAETVLVAFGHESKERLEKHNKLIIDDFLELKNIL